MGKSFLLSKDEPLPPNIDGVMVLWIFRRRAQLAKKSAKIGPLDPSFWFFCPRPLVRSCSIFFRDRMRLVVSSNTEVSGTSEVPQSCKKNFRKSSCCVLIEDRSRSSEFASIEIDQITVCLGSKNIFLLYFHFFILQVVCNRKVWVRAFYCLKMSL